MSGNLGAKMDRMNGLLAQILEHLHAQNQHLVYPVAKSAEIPAPVPANGGIAIQDVVKRGPGRPRKNV